MKIKRPGCAEGCKNWHSLGTTCEKRTSGKGKTSKIRINFDATTRPRSSALYKNIPQKSAKKETKGPANMGGCFDALS